MRKYIKVFSVILSLVFVISSCGEKQEKKESGLPDGELIVNDNVNTIKLAVTAFDTLNPIMTKSVSVAEFMKMVCEPLFEYDDAGNPIGVLAQNYSLSEDGMTVSFNVKPVKFHDSATLTAEDVVYTIQLIRENDTIYSDNVKYISEVFSGEDGRVYIKLVRPIINFAGVLNFPIVKSGTPAEVDQNYVPVGTGPCKYYGKKTANQITFTANKSWHGGDIGFKDVVVHLLKDNSTVIHSFDAGEVDVVSSELTKTNDITPKSEYVVNEYTSNALVFLGINNLSPKFSGKYTRKAIELLCDREKIISVDVYSKGKAVKVPINPYAWFYPQLPEEARDYESIAMILEKDGWTKDEAGYFKDNNGIRLDLEVQILVNEDNEEKIRIAEDISDALNSFGIKASTAPAEFKKYKNSVSQKNYELFVGEVIVDKNMDPGFLTSAYGNYFGYNNPVMDEILSGMAKTTDGNAIKDGGERYGRMFNEEMPFVPLFFRTESVIYNKYISGITAPDSFQIYKDIDKWYMSKTKNE